MKTDVLEQRIRILGEENADTISAMNNNEAAKMKMEVQSVLMVFSWDTFQVR
jgi:hypothetical protein